MILLELAMLFAGLWALVSAKIPSVLFGGGNYQIEGSGVRLLGILLVVPFPAVLSINAALALIFGKQALSYTAILELIIVLVTALIAVVLVRRIRKPITFVSNDEHSNVALSELEHKIAKMAQGSLIYAIFGVFGVAAFVFCPLAYARAGKALRVISTHRVGENYRYTARLARLVAVTVFTFWTTATGWFLIKVLPIALSP